MHFIDNPSSGHPGEAGADLHGRPSDLCRRACIPGIPHAPLVPQRSARLCRGDSCHRRHRLLRRRGCLHLRLLPCWLKVGVENPKASFDTQTTSLTWDASENICETLVELDPDTLEVKPVLLTKLPGVSDDGLTYSFELRNDIKFHDGSTMTTEDVEYSLTRLLAAKAAAACFVCIEGGQEALDGTATTLSGFTAPAKPHFTIRLKQVFSSFLNMLPVLSLDLSEGSLRGGR